jgi:DNA-binding transcriptional LysR family regulator
LPNVILEVEGIETCKRMILRQLGVGFLPQLAVTRELKNGKLRSIQITDAEPLHRNLDVIRSRHRPLNDTARKFLDLLRAATIVGANAKS